MLYMVTWIPSIYPSHVSIYTSTMDPSWVIDPPRHVSGGIVFAWTSARFTDLNVVSCPSSTGWDWGDICGILVDGWW